MTPSTLIRFNEADLGYGKTPVLRQVSCAIASGESVGLVGPNGSGKTTFLRAVLGLLKPSRGSVETDRGRRFAYVPQAENLNFFWPLTVREAVLLAFRSKRAWGRLTAEERDSAESAMERTGITPIAGRLLSEVSGGQRQRTILAQALSQKPDVLLLDEPTRGLDVVAEEDLLSLIQQITAERRMTLLFVTHTLQIPLNYTEKILLFADGSVIGATPEELIRTDKLETIYGRPFTHGEKDGVRWVLPRRTRG
jgi:ABC-type Mn2+/Zn2+ transport system ATPase subunit